MQGPSETYGVIQGDIETSKIEKGIILAFDIISIYWAMQGPSETYGVIQGDFESRVLCWLLSIIYTYGAMQGPSETYGVIQGDIETIYNIYIWGNAGS